MKKARRTTVPSREMLATLDDDLTAPELTPWPVPRRETQVWMALPSEAMYSRLKSYLSRYAEKVEAGLPAAPTDGEAREKGISDSLHLLEMSVLIMLVHGEEFVSDIVRALNSTLTRARPFNNDHGANNAGWIYDQVSKVLSHPNVNGRPYNYIALCDRLVKVIVQVPAILAMYCANVLQVVISIAPRNARILEGLSDEMTSWIAELSLVQEHIKHAHDFLDMLVTCKCAVGRLVENGALINILKRDLAIMRAVPRYERLDYPFHELTSGSLMLVEAPESLTPAWRAFLDMRGELSSLLAEVLEQQDTESVQRWDINNFRVLLPLYFLMSSQQLDRCSFNTANDESLVVHKWFRDFAKALRDGTWDRDPNLRDDLASRFDFYASWAIPRSALKMIVEAVRGPHGGNILHKILMNQSQWGLEFCELSVLLDFADINETDYDGQPLCFQIHSDWVLVDALLDDRVDISTNASIAPIFLNRMGDRQFSGGITGGGEYFQMSFPLDNFKLLRLLQRGLFQQVGADQTDLLLRALERASGRLYAMTLFKIIWSSKIRFEAALEGLNEDQRQRRRFVEDQGTFNVCVKRARIAIALCSTKFNSKASASSALSGLNIDLLRKILAFVWNGPKSEGIQ